MDCHSNTRQDMKVMRKFDSLVVFDTPLKMPYDIDKPIFGIAFNLGDCDRSKREQEIDYYIQYLCALCQWVKDGGTVSEDGNTWYKDGNEYPFSTQKGYFSDKYLPNAYAKNPINYVIKYGCNPKFETGDLEGELIIKNKIREQWKK